MQSAGMGYTKTKAVCLLVHYYGMRTLMHNLPDMSSCTSNSTPAEPSNEAPCLSKREMSNL